MLFRSFIELHREWVFELSALIDLGIISCNILFLSTTCMIKPADDTYQNVTLSMSSNCTRSYSKFKTANIFSIFWDTCLTSFEGERGVT